MAEAISFSYPARPAGMSSPMVSLSVDSLRSFEGPAVNSAGTSCSIKSAGVNDKRAGRTDRDRG